MDVLNVNGKSFVKASVLARELGYTADYIGQLCRGKKVKAQLVGRSWYVDRDSIREHKKTRYRSTHAQSIKAIQLEKQNVIERQNSDAGSHFYRHSIVKPVSKYERDDADLIPNIGTTNRNKNLHVVTLTSQSEIAPETEKHIVHPQEVEHLNVEKSFIHNVISGKPHASIDRQTPRETTRTVNDISLPKRENDPDDTKYTKALANGYGGLFIALTLATSVAIFVVLIGLESHMSVSEQTLVSKYIFDMQTFLTFLFSMLR